ncbi:hypothetical protein CVT26_002277, partial [Gymnopilus dilepis]
MSALSHHSSNPLEARTSDPTNQAYHRRYARARATQERYQDQDHEMSSDELGRWDEGEAYRAHVRSVVRSNSKSATKAKEGKRDETPKAGPSRLRSVTTVSATAANTVTPKRQARPAWVDLDEDEDMESDDPLSLTATPQQQHQHQQHQHQHQHRTGHRANTNTNTNGQGTLDPRKEFGGGDMDMIDDQEGHDDREHEEHEEEHEYVPMPEDVEEEDDELEVLPPFEDASNLKRVVVVDSDDQEAGAEPMEVAYDNDHDEDNAGGEEDGEGEEGEEKPERTEFYNEIVAYMEVQDARMAEQEEADNARNADEHEHEGENDDDEERPARPRSRSSSVESALTPLTDSSRSHSHSRS